MSPLDPMRFFYDNLAAAAAISANNYELGLAYAEASVHANRMHTSSLRTLAICQAMLHKDEAARASIAELLRIEPDLDAETYVARLPFEDRRLAHRLASALVRTGLPAGNFVTDP